MSPTVFQFKKYRFFFLSREESRRHVHIRSPDGEAKFWLEPTVELATSYRLPQNELLELEKIVEEKADEIRKHWDRHFQT